MQTPCQLWHALPIKSLGTALQHLPDHFILSRFDFSNNANKFIAHGDHYSMRSLINLLISWKENQIAYELTENQTKFYGKNKILYTHLMIMILNMLTKNNNRSNEVIKQAIIQISQKIYNKLKQFSVYQRYCEQIFELLQSFRFYIVRRVSEEGDKSKQIDLISKHLIRFCRFIQKYDGFDQQQRKNDQTQLQCIQLVKYLCNNNLVYNIMQIFYTVKIDLQLYLECFYIDQWNEYNCKKVLDNVKKKHPQDLQYYQQTPALRFPYQQLNQLLRMARKYVNRPQIFFAFLTPLLTIFPYIILVNKSQVKYKELYTQTIDVLLYYLNPNNIDQQNYASYRYNLKYIKMLNERNILSELQQSLLVYKLQFDQIELQLCYDKQLLQQMKTQLINDYQKIKYLRQKAIKIIELLYYDQFSRSKGQRVQPNKDNNKRIFISSLNTFDQIVNRKQNKINYPKLEQELQDQQTAYENQTLSSDYFDRKFIKNQSENKKPETYKTYKNQNQKKRQKQQENFHYLQKRNGKFNSNYFTVFYSQYNYTPEVQELYSYKKDFIQLLSHRKYTNIQDIYFKYFQTKPYPFISTKLNQSFKYPKKINFQFSDKKVILDRKYEQYIQEAISIWYKIRNNLDTMKKIETNTNQSNNKKQILTLKKQNQQLQKRKQTILAQFTLYTDQLQTNILDKSQVTINLFPLIRTKIGQYSTVQMIQNLKDFMKQFRNLTFFNHQHSLRIIQQETNIISHKNSSNLQNTNTNKYKTKNKSLNKESQNSNSNVVQLNKSNRNNKTQPSQKINYKYILPQKPNQYYLSSYLPNPFQQAVTGQDMPHDLDYFLELLYEFMMRLNKLTIGQLSKKEHLFLQNFFKQSFFSKMSKHIQIMLIYYIAQYSKYQSLNFSQFFKNFLNQYMPIPHFILLLRYLILQLKLTTPSLNNLYKKLYQIMYNMIMSLLDTITNVRLQQMFKKVNQFTQYGTKSYEEEQSLNSYIQKIKRDFYYDFNCFSQLLQFFIILSYSFQKTSQQILPFAEYVKMQPKRQILYFCKNCMFFVQKQYHLKSSNFITDINCQNCLFSILSRFQLHKMDIDHHDTIYDYKRRIKVKLFQSIKKVNKKLKSRQWKIQQLQYVKYKYNTKSRTAFQQSGYFNQKQTYNSQRKNYSQPLQLQDNHYKSSYNSARMLQSNRNKINKTNKKQNSQIDLINSINQLNFINQIPPSYGKKSRLNSQRQYASHPQFIPENKNKNKYQSNLYLAQFEKYCYNALNIHRIFCENIVKF